MGPKPYCTKCQEWGLHVSCNATEWRTAAEGYRDDISRGIRGRFDHLYPIGPCGVWEIRPGVTNGYYPNYARYGGDA